MDDLVTHDALTAEIDIRPSDVGTFVDTGGTTGPSKGCMLSHNYHEAAARQIAICWGRAPTDVLWTPLPLFHYNALVTAVLGALIVGGSSAIYRRFSVSNFWPEMNRTGATITSTLGTWPTCSSRRRPARDAPVGLPEANTSLRLLGAAPLAVQVDALIRERFGIETFSGAYGVTEAQPSPGPAAAWSTGPTRRRGQLGLLRRPIFDDEDGRSPPTGRRDRDPPQPSPRHVRGLLGAARGDGATSATGGTTRATIGRVDEDGYLYFVDRKATTCAAGARTSRASRSRASSWPTGRWPTWWCTPCPVT